MTDKKESDSERRAREAGENAQSSAESGESGSMINSEPYSGGGQDGDSCTLADGRRGVVRVSATGKTCEFEGGAEESEKD